METEWGRYKLIKLYKDVKMYHSIKKTIDKSLKWSDELLDALENCQTVYIHSFKIDKLDRGKGKGIEMNRISIQGKNVPPNTKYVFLFVLKDNIKVMNMHHEV